MRSSGRLALVLQGIVASTLGGCGGTADGGPPAAVGGGAGRGGGGSGGRVGAAGDDAGGSGARAQAGGTDAGGSGAAAGSSRRPSKPTCAEKPALVSFVQGLSLPSAVDFLGVYLYQSVGSATLYESFGTPCAGASDQAACRAALVSGAPPMGFPQYYLPNLTSPLGAYSSMYVAYTRGDNVAFIADRAQLLSLLGVIDTANEAGLVFLSMGVAPDCTAIVETDDAYYFTVHALGAPCSFLPPGTEFSVTRAGVASSFPVGVAMPCVGRRPEGLLGTLSSAANALGEYYASVAHLEQAAVLAFDAMERELLRFGAPHDLRARARKARADEVRHASRMAELAQRWEAQVPRATAAPSNERSLLSAALENAVEGCVREAWGALSAHYQAVSASDPEARRIWREIAADESEHAELSFALHAWYLQQLASDERTQLEAALERARLELRAELAAAAPPHIALVQVAGVPEPERALALFGELETRALAA